jgi:hypothetical protein
LRGNTTKKKSVVLKFLELSLSTMPPNLSWVWVPRFLVLKLNSRQTYVVLNSTHCNQGRSWTRHTLQWHTLKFSRHTLHLRNHRPDTTCDTTGNPDKQSALNLRRVTLSSSQLHRLHSPQLGLNRMRPDANSDIVWWTLIGANPHI